MKKRLIGIILIVIFVTILITCVTTSTNDNHAFAATENFSPTSNVSLDFWAPEDIERAIEEALISASNNFCIDLQIALINTMNTTINEFIDPLVQAYINTIKENQEEHFNTLMILVFVILITGVAFWRNEGFLDILAAIADIICGEIFASTQDIASLGWIVGIVIMVMGLWFLIHRIRIEITNIQKKRKGEQ